MTNDELFAFIRKNPIGVGCALLSLGLGAAIYFRGDLIAEAETQLADKTAEADRHAANVKNAAQLKEQLDALVSANKEIDGRLVRAAQLGVNYQYFYKMIEESGVTRLDVRQSVVSPSVKGKPSAFVSVGYTVAVSGDYPKILRFLALLEGGSRYCKLLGASCAVTGDRGNPVVLSLSLEVLGVP